MTSRLQRLLQHPHVIKARADFEEFLSSIHALLNDKLFEVRVEFWSYHLTGIGALYCLELALNTVFSPSWAWDFLFIVSSIWAIGFFFSGLILRRHYREANWDAQPQATVVLKSIACSIFFAFIIVVAMSLVSMLFFYDDLYRLRHIESPGIAHTKVISEFIFRNWFVSSFYLMCWMILYIGITSRRQAKQVEVDNLRLQNNLKEAELSSLSNQLNPHFLFNALNNIRFMIHEDASNAEKMLMSLSSVLRYSLESSKQEKVLLEQELEISSRYIDLIQIQFEERLRFELDIPEHLNACKMPPMVLQMLLENAVKHGIENIREGGVIEVRAQLEDGLLFLHVSNDLPGDYDERKSAQEGRDSGIGLLNIGHRLDLLYGERGSIETAIEDARFCVTVSIPQE